MREWKSRTSAGMFQGAFDRNNIWIYELFHNADYGNIDYLGLQRATGNNMSRRDLWETFAGQVIKKKTYPKEKQTNNFSILYDLIRFVRYLTI